MLRIVELCGKRPYTTNEGARGHLASLLDAGERLEDLTLYQCAIHGGEWHVGHKDREIRIRGRGRRAVLD